MKETKAYKHIILGGGVAAGYAAQAFAEEGVPQGQVAIITAENRPPYERPPLSKSFLLGEKEAGEILINEPAFYEQHGIQVYLNTRIKEVDLQQRRLMAEEAVFEYENLMIATGSRVRRLDIPGADLENIFYLRQLGDSRRIREAAAAANKAIVIGGGFIGMEVASVLQRKRLRTTLVFPEEHVWDFFFTDRMAAFFERYYGKRGVRVLSGTRVEAFAGGEDNRVSHVILDDERQLPADLVVAGVGVRPNVDLFRGTGLKVSEKGIEVNRFLETNLPDVYAVGDVAHYRDVLYDKRRHIEHWDNARVQGAHAARMMLGQREVFHHVPYFFSDVFDLSYEFWGDTSGADDVVYRGEVEDGEFSVWWLKEGVLVAAFIMGRPEEERELAQQWIQAEQIVDRDTLANDSYALQPLIDQNSTPG